MTELGKKDKVFGAELLEPYTGFRSQRPNQMPPIDNDKKLICGYDQGLGERLIVCDDLDDAVRLFDGYAQGGALRIKWYIGDDPGFLQVGL